MSIQKLYTVGGNLATLYNRSKALMCTFDPYDPPYLPPGTIRVRTNDSNPPIKGEYTSYETATLVPGTNDIYDVYKSGTSWSYLLWNSTNVVEVISANSTNITDMYEMFDYCYNLTTVPLFNTSNVTNMGAMFTRCDNLASVPLFDTSNVTNMDGMFYNCRSLTSVPLFDTSSVTNMAMMFDVCISLTSVPLFDTSNVTDMHYMFAGCVNVQSGALALYQQASTQANPPTNHFRTFYSCGSNTETGAAELAQIPSDWK